MDQVYILSHLDAEPWPRSKSLHSELDREVSGLAPAQAVVPALHHHGASRTAVVQVEADAVDQNHQFCLFVHNYRAQVQAIRKATIVHYEGGRRPGAPCVW